MKKFTVIILAAGILLSCISYNGNKSATEAKKLDRLWIDDIRQMIEEDKICDAYQELSFLEREAGREIPHEEMAELKSVILDQIVTEFNEKIQQTEYSEAYRYYCSLQGIEREDLIPDWSAEQILTLLAEEMAEEGDRPVAFIIALQALSQGESTEELLVFILKMVSILLLSKMVALVKSQKL